MIHDQIIKTFSADLSTPPIIIDENGCLELLTQITGKHLISLDECRGGEFSFISLYEIPEDKKLFDITTVRNCIRDISLKQGDKARVEVLLRSEGIDPHHLHACEQHVEDRHRRVRHWVALVFQHLLHLLLQGCEDFAVLLVLRIVED